MQLVTNVLQEKKVFMDKSYIFLKSLIGSGGEANIYTVQINSELVAKVYHQPHGDYARKLAFMVANPPVDPLAKEGRVSIAWATELVTDLGLVVGFLMPKLDTSKAKPIFQYYNPSERRKESPTFSYVSLMRTARNLARAVRSVHSRGYVIGDVNESNVLVAEDAIVTLVDTDSFQVNDGTTVYRCTVGKPEYTPPELQGVSFRDVDRSVEHDLFGLGVLIYQLLMEGTHPFGGVFRGQGEAPELKERIKAGHFPHGRRGIPYNPMPLAPSFQMLPVALQELFLLCFEQGHGNSAARPTADVWSKALGVAEDGLVRCGVNGQHYYSGHLGVCPWCERAAKLGGRDPFPALGGISSGQQIGNIASINSTNKITPPKLKPKTTPVKNSPSISTASPKTNPNPPVKSNIPLANPSTTTSSSSITPISPSPVVSNVSQSNLVKAKTQHIPYFSVLLSVIISLIAGITVSLWFLRPSTFPRILMFGKTAEYFFNEGKSKISSTDKSKENIENALSDFNEAIRLQPNYSKAYVNRGVAKYTLGDKQGSLSDYNEAIRLNPELAVAYFNRGNAKSDLGDDQGTLSDYKEVIRLKPNDSKAYNNLAFIYDKMGDKQKAQVYFLKAKELTKRN